MRVAGAGLAAVGWAPRGRARAVSPSAVVVRRQAADRFDLVFSPETARAFKILQLTDTHFGNPDAVKKEADVRSWGEIPRLVERERPDFIMHTGDFIDNDVSGSVAGAFDKMHALGVPWALAPGNHDGPVEGTLSPERYRERMAEGTGVMGYVERDGRRETAYRIDVIAGDSGAAARPVATVMVFDSGPTGGTKHVSSGQLAWFDEQVEADRRRGNSGPIYAMVHIPVIQFKKLADSGRYTDRLGEEICFETDTGRTFEVFKRSGRVRAILSGHDHENTFHGVWDGVELIYGRVSGWSAYGGGPRGGRLLELDLAQGTHSHRIVLPSDV